MAKRKKLGLVLPTLQYFGLNAKKIGPKKSLLKICALHALIRCTIYISSTPSEKNIFSQKLETETLQSRNAGGIVANIAVEIIAFLKTKKVPNISRNKLAQLPRLENTYLSAVREANPIESRPESLRHQT